MMKKAIINVVDSLAKKDPNVVLVNADLGFGLLDKFEEQNPTQYYNFGISEQAMASIAAGMALEGHCVFTYSIGNFPTMRCIEQIRNDICYHKTNVKVLSVGCGFTYGQLGMSHHATEDIAMMRALPELRVYSPATIFEAEAAVLEAYHHDGPCYIRMSKSVADYPMPENLDIHKVIKVKSGSEVAIFATGDILSEAMAAADQLAEFGISCGVYSIPSIKPIDAEGIMRIAKEAKLVVTVEEHNTFGGFGGAVAEVIAQIGGGHGALLRIGLDDLYPSIVGSQAYLRNYYGLSSAKIVEKICKQLGREDLL